MKTFYRIENKKTRRGPYTDSGPIYWDCLKMHDNSGQHPTPFQEGLWSQAWQDDPKNRLEVCGFEHMEMLLAWFPLDVIEAMQPYSSTYHVASYRVSQEYIRTGVFQSVALKTALELDQHIDLGNLLTIARSYFKVES